MFLVAASTSFYGNNCEGRGICVWCTRLFAILLDEVHTLGEH
jgi:hypothetical protein